MGRPQLPFCKRHKKDRTRRARVIEYVLHVGDDYTLAVVWIADGIHLLAQPHDSDVQAFEVSRRDVQQLLHLVSPDPAASGVVGNAVERAHGLVVVVFPAAHLILKSAGGGVIKHRSNACFLRRAVGGQLGEDTDELIGGKFVSRRKILEYCRRPTQTLCMRLVHTT